MKIRTFIILQLLLVSFEMTIWISSVHAAHNLGEPRVLSLYEATDIKRKYPHDAAMRILRNHKIIDHSSKRRVTFNDNGKVIYHEFVTVPTEEPRVTLPDFMKIPKVPYGPESGGAGLLSPEFLALVRADLAKQQAARKPPPKQTAPKPAVAKPKPNPAPKSPYLTGRSFPLPKPGSRYPAPKPAAPVSNTGGGYPAPKPAAPVSNTGGGYPAPKPAAPVSNTGGGFPAPKPAAPVSNTGGGYPAPKPGRSFPLPKLGSRYPAPKPVASLSNIGGGYRALKPAAPVSNTGGGYPAPKPAAPVPNTGVENALIGQNLQAQQPEEQPHMGPSESMSSSYSGSYSESYSDHGDTYYAVVEEEDEGSSPWPMLFGMVLMIFVVLSGIGIYFLVVKVVMPKRKGDDSKPSSGRDRGPLPSTPDEKGRRPSKASSKKDMKKKNIDSDTDDDDRRGGKSSDDEENPYLDPMELKENPYLDPTEINMPGSDYEISQLRDAPPPPSKHYLDDEEKEGLQLHDEPGYMEFEG